MQECATFTQPAQSSLDSKTNKKSPRGLSFRFSQTFGHEYPRSTNNSNFEACFGYCALDMLLLLRENMHLLDVVQTSLIKNSSAA